MSIEKKLREGSVHCKRRNNRVHRRMEKRQKNRKKWIYWGAATIFAVMLSVLLGLLMKKDPPPVLVPGAIVDSAVTAITADASDISYLQREAKIQYNSINDPYKYGDDIVFSSTAGSASYTRMVVYQTDLEESYTIPAKVKYNNLTGMVMNEKYIVYLDASTGGGGRICSYNRNTEEFDIIKEYAYAMPKLCLYGEYLAFLQQAGENTDRLYIYHLETGESVTPKVFEGSAAQTGGIHLDGTTLTYAVTYYEDDILMSRVTTLDLTTGAEQNYDWSRLVYSPQKNGNYIAFLSSASGVADDIYLSENGGQPQLLVSDVTNMKIGDGFLAYTKGDVVYAYVFETGKSYRLNTTVSKGLLASVSGKSVCWYDVTSYDDVDIVKYANMEW